MRLVIPLGRKPLDNFVEGDLTRASGGVRWLPSKSQPPQGDIQKERSDLRIGRRFLPMSRSQGYPRRIVLMTPQQIVQQYFGSYLKPNVYPRPLPPAFAPWYCYTVDGGHSLVALPQVFEGQQPVTDYLVPLPVKFVEERGQVRADGIIVVNVPYDPNLGAVVPDGYEEF